MNDINAGGRLTFSISRRTLLLIGASAGAIAIAAGAFALGHTTASPNRLTANRRRPTYPVKVSQPPTTVPTEKATIPSTTTVPATTTTVPQTTTTTTSPLRQILAPASTAPVVNECSIPVITSADGNVSPLFGTGGCINVRAWQWYANSYPQVMSLGPSVTESEVIATMCSITDRTIPTIDNASTLAAAYYGWAFASDPRLTQWPYYPNVSSNECSG